MQIKTKEDQFIKANTSAWQREEERTGKNTKKKSGKNIFAGNIGRGDDLFMMKKKHAKKKALKIINDAWNVDRKIDQGIEDIKTNLESLKNEFTKNQDIIAEGNAKKEELREEYGISKDSQEQKDLELLEKQADSRRSGGSLFTEEEKRLAELENQPLTEYQKRCLEIHKGLDIYKERADRIEGQIIGCNASIRGIKLERLKEMPPMVKAQKQAKDILEKANEEAIGLLVEEAKNHIDETYEEIKEKAEEKAEKKAEQEEKLEAVKEEKEKLEQQVSDSQQKNHEAEEVRREQQEKSKEDMELLEDTKEIGQGVSGSVSDVQREIKEMLRKMKLLEEDLKGTSLDEEI